MICLYDSSAKSGVAKSEGRWFDIISLLTAPPEALAPTKFLSKNL